SPPAAALRAPPPRADRPRPAACPACQGPPAASADALCAGCRRRAAEHEQTIPGYLLIRELGRGGMGVVHLALCEQTAAPDAPTAAASSTGTLSRQTCSSGKIAGRTGRWWRTSAWPASTSSRSSAA